MVEGVATDNIRGASGLVPPKRPRTLPGSTTRYRTGCGWVYVTVNVDESGKPIEVFASFGKSGGCGSATSESLARTLSVALRCGVDAAELAAQYVGIACNAGEVWDEGIKVTSCAAAVGLAIRKVLNDMGRGVGPAKDDDDATVVGVLAGDSAIGSDDEAKVAEAEISERKRERKKQGL